MRFTLITDYVLRKLFHLGTCPARLCTIPEMAFTDNLSQNRLMKNNHQFGVEALTLLDYPTCPIAPACASTSTVDEALTAFFTALKYHTLADLLAPQSEVLRLIFMPNARLPRFAAPADGA